MGLQEIIIVYEDERFVEGIKRRIHEVNGIFEENIKLAKLITATIPLDKLSYINKLPGVTFAGIDEKLRKLQVDYTWHIDFMKVLEFHEKENKGEGIKIAIIDTGVDYTHPALKNNYKGGYNSVKDTNDAMDVGSHGTAVAGLAAADDSQEGIIGIAPSADLYGICAVSDSGDFRVSWIVKGIAWAIENNMDIINISLGGSPSSKRAYESVLKEAKDKGIVVVAAAGSDGSSGLDAPAICDDIIAVASIRSEVYNYQTHYSNYGPQIDVSAPGVYLRTTKAGGGHRYLYGTSAASPIIAGVMALLRKKYPTKSVNDLAAVMYGMCKDLGEPGKDIYYGHGVPILSSQEVSTFPVTVSSYPRGATVQVI